MRTRGELEAAICEGVSRFEQDYMGRGPKSIHAHLLNDLLVVRLQGVLTAAEQQLVKSLPAEKGRELLKQVRTHLVETARPLLEEMVHEVTGVKVRSLHHDISTVTGEEVLLFPLTDSPDFREAGKRQVFRAGNGVGRARRPQMCQLGRHPCKGALSTSCTRSTQSPSLPCQLFHHALQSPESLTRAAASTTSMSTIPSGSDLPTST